VVLERRNLASLEGVPNVEIAAKGGRNLIASIGALSMISIPSFAPSACKPHDKDAKREQNPRYTRNNGLTAPRYAILAPSS
jgi:hypothetical protein